MTATHQRMVIEKLIDSPFLNRAQQVFNGLLKSPKARWRIYSGGRTQMFFGKDEVLLPIQQGDMRYGSLRISGLQELPPKEVIHTLQLHLGAIIKNIQNELELKKISDTIRPRAIALSTIHTIHRLISGCFSLEMLLPRIARLGLQVLRARECSILLLEPGARKIDLRLKVILDRRGGRETHSRRATTLQRRVLKYGNPILHRSGVSVPLVDEDIIGVLSISKKISGMPFDFFDQEILTTFAEQAVTAIKNARLYEERENTTVGTIQALAAVLDIKEAKHYLPAQWALKTVMAIADELKMREEEKRALYYAAMLHETGKLAIPKTILQKPSGLTETEYHLIKEHPTRGVKILEPISSFKPVVPIILHHHEHYDGSGYPAGLKGSKIPLGARIMACVNAFEAMVSARPYRKQRTIAEAAAELGRHAGTQFDPQVVEVFLKVIRHRDIQKMLTRELKKL